MAGIAGSARPMSSICSPTVARRRKSGSGWCAWATIVIVDNFLSKLSRINRSGSSASRSSTAWSKLSFRHIYWNFAVMKKQTRLVWGSDWAADARKSIGRSFRVRGQIATRSIARNQR
jgi:hypothetical protein